MNKIIWVLLSLVIVGCKMTQSTSDVKELNATQRKSLGLNGKIVTSTFGVPVRLAPNWTPFQGKSETLDWQPMVQSDHTGEYLVDGKDPVTDIFLSKNQFRSILIKRLAAALPNEPMAVRFGDRFSNLGGGKNGVEVIALQVGNISNGLLKMQAIPQNGSQHGKISIHVASDGTLLYEDSENLLYLFPAGLDDEETIQIKEGQLDKLVAYFKSGTRVVDIPDALPIVGLAWKLEVRKKSQSRDLKELVQSIKRYKYNFESTELVTRFLPHLKRDPLKYYAALYANFATLSGPPSPAKFLIGVWPKELVLNSIKVFLTECGLPDYEIDKMNESQLLQAASAELEKLGDDISNAAAQ